MAHTVSRFVAHMAARRRTVCAAVVCVLCLLMGLIAALPAQAAQQHPTLTVHATVSGEQSPSTGMASLLPTGAHAAGVGYVFRLDRLDAGKISARIPANDSREQRSEEILADPSAFLADGARPVYGSTDESGTVTTAASSYASDADGVWRQDAAFSSSTGRISGGRTMLFDGTETAPSYWLIRLVKAPKGAGGFEPGVVELPYQGENGYVWDVVIYPKVSEPSTTPPATNVTPKPQPKGPLANTGSVVTWALIALAVLLLVSAVLTAADRLRERREARRQAATPDGGACAPMAGMTDAGNTKNNDGWKEQR